MQTSIISYASLEQLHLSIENSSSLEAYTFIHRIYDNFSRILTNIRTTIFSFNKNFKRSELKFFHEAKTLGVANLFKSRYLDMQVMVPIPSGMKVPYLTAVDTLDRLLTELNINDTLDILLEYFKSTDQKEDPRIIANKINHLTKERLEKELRVVFSANKTGEVPLNKVIASLEEVKDLDTKILKYGQIFQQTTEVCKKIDILEAEIDREVSALETSTELDKNYVKNLYTLVRAAAVALDSYGVILAECQRVEHNFVLVLNKLILAAADK